MAPSATQSVANLPLKVASNGTSSDNLLNLDLKDAELDGRVLKTFRCLIADLCQQFNGGHPGGAMGMAAIGVALWKYAMKYSPENPKFFNRDRFVLSNGKPSSSEILRLDRMLILRRTHLSLSVYLPTSCWIQAHVVRTAQIIPLLEN